jgi:hypothetical protein
MYTSKTAFQDYLWGICHSSESWNPEQSIPLRDWIPAYAGITGTFMPNSLYNNVFTLLEDVSFPSKAIFCFHHQLVLFFFYSKPVISISDLRIGIFHACRIPSDGGIG